MTDDLFPVETVLSPRAAWFKKHDVRTSRCSEDEDEFGLPPWSAWIGNNYELGDDLGTGETEDEAIVMLCKYLNLKLWNEETL